jgi:hypothetical protein
VSQRSFALSGVIIEERERFWRLKRLTLRGECQEFRTSGRSNRCHGYFHEKCKAPKGAVVLGSRMKHTEKRAQSSLDFSLSMQKNGRPKIEQNSATD